MVEGEVQGVCLLVPERPPRPLEDHPCSFCVVCEGGGRGGGGGGEEEKGEGGERRRGRGEGEQK